MKKLKFLLAFVFLIAFLSSCNDENDGVYYKAKLRGGNAHFKTIVIDSCEYLYDANFSLNVPAVLTHKGNCKFCAARAANKLNPKK